MYGDRVDQSATGEKLKEFKAHNDAEIEKRLKMRGTSISTSSPRILPETRAIN